MFTRRHVVAALGASDGAAARAGAFTIQISTNKSSWTTIATKGNATAGTWQTLAWSGKTRYIRFSFSNPNKDKVLGYLAEVKALSS